MLSPIARNDCVDNTRGESDFEYKLTLGTIIQHEHIVGEARIRSCRVGNNSNDLTARMQRAQTHTADDGVS